MKNYGQSYKVSKTEIDDAPLNRVGPSCLCGSREWCDTCRPEIGSSIPRKYSTDETETPEPDMIFECDLPSPFLAICIIIVISIVLATLAVL